MPKFLLFLLGCVAAGSLNAQSLSEIRIKEYYWAAPLTRVLHDLETKYPIQLAYDSADVAGYKFSDNGRFSFEGITADRAFEVICRDFPKLMWYEDGEGVVHLERVSRETIAKRSVVNERFEGAATRTNFALTGTVRDKSNGESLAFATVAAKGTSGGASTNIDGYFTLFGVPSDTATIKISFVGYETATVYLSPELAAKPLLVELEPLSLELEGISVVAEREELLQTNEEVSMIKLTPKKIANLPNVGEKDIMRAFQLMPGVSASNEASSGLYVRGGTPDQNLVLYDGFTVYHVDHLFGFFSAFNSNAIKDVQLYKGGFEAAYGGRLSSVVDITGKEGNKKAFNIGGDISLLSLNGYVETPIGKNITFLAAARRSWRGPIYNTIFDRFSEENDVQTPGGANARFSSNETTVASYFYDLNSKLTWKPNAKDIFSLSFYNGTDDLDNSRIFSPQSFGGQTFDFQNDIIDLTNWGNTGGSMKWSRRWSKSLYGNSLVSFSNFFSSRNRSVEGTITDADGESTSFSRGTTEDNDLQDFSFKTDFEWKLGRNNQLEFGANATAYDISYAYTQNDTLSILDRQDQGSTVAGYLQNKMTFWDKRVNLVPGARITYYDLTDEVYPELRLSAQINVSERIKLKGAWGQYHQFANRVIREDVLSGSREFWILADDESVPVSYAEHNILGISYETKNYLFDVEAYYKELEGLSEYSLRFTPTFGDIDYDENFFTGDGTSRGVEFLVQKKYGKFNGWASYTLSETIYEFPELSDVAFPAAQDVTHETKLVGMYKYKKWDLAATWVYATGKPYTAPEGAYSIELLDGSTVDYITVGQKNGLRLPDYHRLDVSAKVNFKMGINKSPGSISFSLFNVYNRQNTWYKEYEVEDGELFETDVKFLGLTPNVTLSMSLR